MMKTIICFFVSLMVSTSFAGVYKWTDANGRVHYSDKPINKSKAEKLNTRQTVTKADSEAAKTRLKAMQLRQKRNEELRKAERRAAAAEAAKQAKLVNNCNISKTNLNKFKNKATRKYTINKSTGERHWMTSEEIDAMTEKQKNYYEENC